MKKAVSLIFKMEMIILGFIFLREFNVMINKVNIPSAAQATGIECLLPGYLPTIPELPCFPSCLPTCPPKPTPTEIVPTPTSELPNVTPTGFLPSPVPTSPAVGGDGGGSSQGGGGGEPVEAPHCGSQIPPAPYLRSVTKIKSNEAELLWDPVDPATHYAISYGPSSGNYLYGVPNTGKVTSFSVGALGSGNYCFVVRAVNDCAPSDPSSEKCTGGVGGKVLGATVLGATGSFKDNLSLVIFLIGFICIAVGLRLLCPAKRQA